jgi:hypothetical protein
MNVDPKHWEPNERISWIERWMIRISPRNSITNWAQVQC